MTAFLLPINGQPRFQPGRIVMTRAVAALVDQGRLNPGTYLGRHLFADWGDLDKGYWRRNDEALHSAQARLHSVYEIEPGLTLWIITEWDRSVTTLLLPSDH